MRNFTQEEKERIINTPIDERCFNVYMGGAIDVTFMNMLEIIRQSVLEGKCTFEQYVNTLPKSYNVVKI